MALVSPVRLVRVVLSPVPILPSRSRVCPVSVLLTLYRCTDRLRPNLLVLSVRMVRTSPLWVLLHGTRVTVLCLPLARSAVGLSVVDVPPSATTALPRCARALHLTGQWLHTHGHVVDTRFVSRRCVVSCHRVAVATIFPCSASARRLFVSIPLVLLTMRLLVPRMMVHLWLSADRGSSVARSVRSPLMARSVLLMTCARLTLTWWCVLLMNCRHGLSTASGRARSGWPVHFLISCTLPLMCVLTCTCTWLTVPLTSRYRLRMLGMIPPVVLAGAEVCRLVVRLTSA